ncbi:MULTISPECIES: ABC transporter ATP-binding protein [Clostridia]|uniref:ABC transporter ATP-binding protein n=2 Tax=Clostridia TaxID=186801 RepID=A0A8I0DKS9_9CLOT|nr:MULTISPECIES: ABC transporter ATP-binding protein [Clostridia]MBC5639413.1 ABC transporter ATP-binding protein [Clostridium lentum]MBC5653506.1 ABC transporter ATP-binding protein [Blautia lenta]
MKKLLKYLRPFAGAIIVAIMLLFVQAISDLSLPSYMSNIVNIGIQQKGIEDAVPKAIKSSELNKLLLFTNSDDKKVVEDNYKLIRKKELSNDDYEKYIKQYPELANEDIYVLDTKSKDVKRKLNEILGRPMLITSLFESGDATKVMGDSGNVMAAPEGVDMANMDPFMMLSNMPEEQVLEIIKGINEKLDEMPESMVTQSAVTYVREQYKELGIDIDKVQTNYLFMAGAKMLGVALIGTIAAVIVTFIAARIAAALGRNLRKDVFNKVVGFSNAEFDRFSTASLITRTTNDIQQIMMLIVMGLRIVFYAPILGIGGIVKVVKSGAGMGWVIVVAVVSILSLVAVLFVFAIPKFKMVQKLVDKLNLVTRESLTGMLVIRAFSTEKYEEEKFERANMNLTKTNLFVNRAMSMMMPLMMFIMNGVTLLIVWVGSHRVDSGVMQVGDMMAFMQYVMQIIMAFLMISMVSVILPRALVSAGRVSEVLNTDIAIKNIENPVSFKVEEKGEIEFKNVSFKYPGADEYILKDINFKTKSGETTAFIGSTGSGKSTLINLIPRFYDVTSGEILIDGENIKNVSLHDLREKIGFVPQKGMLFSGTIESNLKYGGEHISDEYMHKAAEIAQATEFISSKESGFNTEISQGGTNVSGGQKQRLAIARALAKNSEIFIFDDSFSALDFKTDAKLRKAINEELSDSTLLIVAQRISTIMNADQILVLDEGKVVGKGTHKELMENCEVYRQIALSQLSKEELQDE